MQSDVERVFFILVPLSDKFDFISLFFILFYSLQTSRHFVSSLTETISYVVCNVKNKDRSNKNFN